jgi:putative ABC transport system permease protein
MPRRPRARRGPVLGLTLRNLAAHRRRYALCALAVVLGVAFLAGSLVLTDTMRAAFDDAFSSTGTGADVVARRPSAIDTGQAASPAAAPAARLDDEALDAVRGLDGVALAEGTVQGPTQLVEEDGTVDAALFGGITIGTNWLGDARLSPLTLAEGRAPAAPGEAVVDRRTVQDQGWALGDEVRVMAATGPEALELVGVATYGDVDGLAGATMVATDAATAQALFGEPGRWDAVLVAAAPGTDPAALAGDVEAALGAVVDGPVEAVTGAEDAADREEALAGELSFVGSFLLAFAGVAVFVAVFVIANTFTVVVAQRVRELALLRAIGARRGQVLGSVVAEALGVGVVASVAGLGAGVALSYGLHAALGAAGLDVPEGAVVVAPRTIVAALVTGVVVTVAAAVVPAWRAGSVAPVAALRDVAVDRSGASTARVVGGLALAAPGLVAVAVGVSGDDGLPLVGAGLALAAAGALVLSPVLARPALSVIGAPLAALGVTGRYARENARRTPRRTAATAAALTIGVGLVGFVTTIAASADAAIGDAVDRSFRSDYVVLARSWEDGLAPSIEADLAAAPEVAAVAGLRTTPVEVEGAGEELAGVDTATIEGLHDLEVARGSLAAVHGDGTALPTDVAESLDAAIGDTVTVRFADGHEADLVVRATYDGDLLTGGGGVLVDLPTFEAEVTDQRARMVFVDLADGVGAAEGRRAVEAALADWPNAELQDRAEFKEAVGDDIDAMLNLLYGLLALAVVIALLGIANTLALSVHERTSELGLLRAVGMQRRQVRAAVRWEAVAIAVLGAAAGTLLAVGSAWAVVAGLDGQVTRLVVPTGRLVAVLAVAAVAGVVAAVGPARRAARLDVLAAVSHDG